MLAMPEGEADVLSLSGGGGVAVAVAVAVADDGIGVGAAGGGGGERVSTRLVNSGMVSPGKRATQRAMTFSKWPSNVRGARDVVVFGGGKYQLLLLSPA
jgi:hypothetical protein